MHTEVQILLHGNTEIKNTAQKNITVQGRIHFHPTDCNSKYVLPTEKNPLSDHAFSAPQYCKPNKLGYSGTNWATTAIL